MRGRFDRTVVLSGLRLHAEAVLSEGTFALSQVAGGPMALSGAQTQAVLEDGTTLSTAGRPWAVSAPPRSMRDAHGAGTAATLTAESGAGLRLHLEICVYKEQPLALLRLGLENGGRRRQRVRSLSPLVAGGLAFAQDARVLRHGWQSWTPTISLSVRQRDLDAGPPVLAPAPPASGRGVFASEEVAALHDPAAGGTLLLGFVSARAQGTRVHVDAGRQRVEAAAYADGAQVAPGETLWSERLLVQFGDATASFAHYAEALAREMGARPGVTAAPPTGWCSWYEYFWNVSEADVLKNLRALQEQRRALPVEYVQIDDGYQENIGDWTTANDKFPHGMAWLAEQVRDASFRPGIWLAPLLVGATSRLYRAHPGWVVRDGEGAPAVAARNWNQDCYALDTTHPRAEAWLRDLFRQVTEGWGYDYVKVDFLYGGAVAGLRRDAHASRIEAYRRGLQAIRAGVGDRFVLGCGALMGPSVGLVDAMRIGPDVAPWWRHRAQTRGGSGRPRAGGEPSAENALRNTFTRAWMHGRLWANDPDCLLARERRTKLTLPEVQSLATAIALSGGALFISDDLTQISAARRDIISLLLPPLGEAATARDLMTSPMPAIFELKVRRPFESWRLLACFNWERRRRSMKVALPPGRWLAFELWECHFHGEYEGELTLPDVPAHGVRLLALRRPRPRPQLLATTFHVSMGGRELQHVRFDARTNVLRVDLLPVALERGDVLVRVPRGYRFREAHVNGTPLTPARRERGLLGLRLTLNEPARLKVAFAVR